MKKKKLRLVKKAPRSKPKKGKGKVLRKIIAGAKLSILCVLIGGALALAVGGSYKFYSDSGVFILKDVEVLGNSQLNRKVILDYLQVEFGLKLLDIPVRDQEKALEKHPWVKKATVSRRFPSKLMVSIEEKRPLAFFYFESKTKSEWYGITTSGKMLPGVSLNRFNLPVLDNSPPLDSARLKGLAELLSLSQKEFPGIFNAMSQIQYKGHDDFVIYSRDNRFRYLVSTEMDAMSLLSFWDLLVRRHGSDFIPGQTIDLRIEGSAYVS